MPSLIFDINYLKAGWETLESYLLSNILFWPIHESSPPGEREFPRLTIGNLLISQKRLEIRLLSPQLSRRFRSIRFEIMKIQNKWSNAWERKAEDEIKSRIRQWNHYLQELKDHPERHEVFYPNEVTVRLIIDLLLTETDHLNISYLEVINKMDDFLQEVFVPGRFIWEEDLADGLDKDGFWYLWGVPRIEETLPR